MSDPPGETVAVRRDVRYRRILDEGVVIRQEAGEVIGLNPTAARILELLRERATPREVVAALEREYDVEGHTVAEDVARFLTELVARGVIEKRREVTP